MTPHQPTTIESVFFAIERAGLAARGAFRLDEAERTGRLAELCTIVLIGVTGRLGWDAFAASPEACDGRDDPLDRFSRRVIDGLAELLGAVALYPFGGPPYRPFQQWAQRAESVHPSPIGLLIHPVYGLWHSYRGALGLCEAPELPEVEPRTSPCASCHEKPCLGACPVRAFTTAGYNAPTCAAHLRAAAGGDCMDRGCLARRACPAGAAYTHVPAQASFAMRAFRRAHGDASVSLDCAP